MLFSGHLRDPSWWCLEDHGHVECWILVGCIQVEQASYLLDHFFGHLLYEGEGPFAMVLGYLQPTSTSAREVVCGPRDSILHAVLQ